MNDIDELWEKYKTDGDIGTRNTLILHYQDMVEKIARKAATKHPQHIEYNDLKSYAEFGLIDAIEKFQPERGLKFETYAAQRIQGQIIDELRKIDWVPRNVHTQTKNIMAAYTELCTSLQREPSSMEIADHLGISVQQLSENKSEGRYVNMLPLDVLWSSGENHEDDWTINAFLQDYSQDSIGEYEIGNIKTLIAEAIDPLSEQEAIILTLFYFEGLDVGEVSRLLGTTVSRTHKLHARTLAGIKNKLSAV
jgi:RNA polymerase sigma factor for flagellar operon FliA